MKRKVMALTLVLGLSLGLAACGGSKTEAPAKDDKAATEQSAENAQTKDAAATDAKEGEKTDANAEQKTIEATITEKKDMMLVIKDADGKEYPVSISDPKAIEGYDSLAAGDNVQITYTGEMSETDSFNGEIISIVKK
ncbi:hypothetical protein [Criibacterium bergeronii]|uniref:DUF1344 domain-containing protein n=1 Tax=Criibacterium bergeronii TaxID=1871336 RepID=A0A371ILN8_9FIRM|nr:hypothetical protein [Criibacterium bergeronii]MBS6062781.1 DUF1344 domain-containing protein [Peptostreptococcaceae bacterium]RDY21360.1 DUF1344 domain-containing protein [Criibacterium bergeronii]